MVKLKFKNLSSEENEKLNKYIYLLLEENKKQNLISRKIRTKDIIRLVYETLLLNLHVKGKVIIDAGSGNGLLGIVLSILNKDKKVILVELRKKRVVFLKETAEVLGLKNTNIMLKKIDDFFILKKSKKISLVSRGFPSNEKLLDLLNEGVVDELITITSKYKIRKLEKMLKNKIKNVYNIKFREDLKILKVEKVSRET